MITKTNLKAIIGELGAQDLFYIRNCDVEYVIIEACFFNVGAVVSSELTNDLPSDIDERIESGCCVVLDPNDPIFAEA